jgi:hypothetical protein
LKQIFLSTQCKTPTKKPQTFHHPDPKTIAKPLNINQKQNHNNPNHFYPAAITKIILIQVGEILKIKMLKKFIKYFLIDSISILNLVM